METETRVEMHYRSVQMLFLILRLTNFAIIYYYVNTNCLNSSPIMGYNGEYVATHLSRSNPGSHSVHRQLGDHSGQTIVLG